MFITGFYANTINTLLIWLSSDTTLSLAFIYFLEFSTQEIREKSNATLYYSYTGGVISAHLINIFIKDFRVMYVFIFVFVLSTVFVYFFMKETPYFFYAKGKFDEFSDIINRIYDINKEEIETTPGNNNFGFVFIWVFYFPLIF
jgi:hypothetical protein